MGLALGLLKEISFAMCSLTGLESKNQMTFCPKFNVTTIQENVIYLKRIHLDNAVGCLFF